MSLLGKLRDKAQSWLGRDKPAAAPVLHPDAVRHSRYDQQIFDEVRTVATDLDRMATRLNRTFDYTDDLVRDTFMQFYQGAPMVRAREEMRPGWLHNHAVATNLIAAPDVQSTRAFTRHDKYGSAMATLGVAKKIESLLEENEALQEAARKAEQERQQAEQAQQDADAAAQAGQDAADALQQAMNGYEGEGPLTEAQQAALDAAGRADADLGAALDDATQAQAAMEAADQALQAEAERARQACRRPVEEAVKEAGEELEREAALFRGWGVDPAQVERMSFQERAALARRLSNHHLSEFVRELGRWKVMQKAQYAHRTTNAREEAFDTELTGNLHDVLAGEFANLGHQAGTIDFLTRMEERQLLGKKYRGSEREGQGAIIALVDTSTSMKQKDRHGVTRECFSKGFALAMLEQARVEKRDFVGIIFAAAQTPPRVFFFPKGQGSLDDVLAFTETFLGGGTDYERPLDLAVDVLEQEFNSEGRSRGDLCLITDDLCRVSNDWLQQYWARKKRLGFRTFGLSLGVERSDSTLDALCDNVRGLSEFHDPSVTADIIRTV